ncbi:conserved protein, unknown function [Hepatocystis sp. ex Piliocolobus tephrosceles]|nr:conserved protein, unknown function [Hepatocystis sp. ex Piliocolobus tephrosceles]
MLFLHRINRKHFSTDVNLLNLLRKKAILFENVKRENCRKDLILNYFNIKGIKIKNNDIHIMTNILCRPTGRIMVLIDDIKKQNFNFDFDNMNEEHDTIDTSNDITENLYKKNITKSNYNNSNDNYDKFQNGSTSTVENGVSDTKQTQKENRNLNGDSNTNPNPNAHTNTNPNTNPNPNPNDEESNQKVDKLHDQSNDNIVLNHIYNNPNLKNLFNNCKFHICDNYEIERYVEECERFIRFSEDIKRISKFENLHKIVTIINIPNCYGRKELSHVIYECAGIKVEKKNIIFRFKKNGIQSDCAYVLCNNTNDANVLIHKMQEYPIAKKYHLKEFYGTAFLYASKNNLFISSEKLDYSIFFSKYLIFTCGWYKDISIKEFESFLITLKIFPKKIIKINYNKINQKENEHKQNTESEDIPEVFNSEQKRDIIDTNTKKDLTESDQSNNKLVLSENNPNHILININEPSSDKENSHITTNDTNDLNTSSFVLFFENMRMVKKVFTKLDRLKKKWKIATTSNFYAYPKIPDIHFINDDIYNDENEYEDSDIDEEIEY